MSFDDVYVKNYEFLDSKPYFASVEIDVFIVFSTFLGLGLMLTNSPLPFLTFFISGIVFAGIYNKIKNSKAKGFFWQLIYLIGLKQPKTLPPSYMRIFVGG